MQSENVESSPKGYFVSISIIGLLFFIFGFVTWLNGSLIPFLKIACELNQAEAYLVSLAFYISYTVMALPMSAVLVKTGYKNGMVLGLLGMAVGALIFIPAAHTRIYPIFLFGLFVMGAGLTILQTASNPYVVVIGPRKTAAVRIGFMGVANKAAGILSPLVFTALMLGGISKYSDANLMLLTPAQKEVAFNQLASRLVIPYIVMAVILVFLAGMIKFSPLPEINDEGEETGSNTGAEKTSIFQFPQLILGAIALFFYVGVEVMAGDTIGLYGRSLGIPFFGKLTSYTMAFMVLGYLVGIVAIPRFIKQETALIASAALGFVFSLCVLFTSPVSTGISGILLGWLGVSPVPDSVMFVALLGFANAMVWPTIWPLALDGLGKFTKIGSAILIMAIAGGATIPLLYGLLSDTHSPQLSYWILFPCYLVIFLYAIKGHKVRSWKSKLAAGN
ncbi:MAG TPA: sugar MFS transporter [Candidatus Kryptobacter bacterium]|nr:sugar MFS transporter [Candidatus Kryptobacter bacterium]